MTLSRPPKRPTTRMNDRFDPYSRPARPDRKAEICNRAGITRLQRCESRVLAVNPDQMRDAHHATPAACAVGILSQS